MGFIIENGTVGLIQMSPDRPESAGQPHAFPIAGGLFRKARTAKASRHRLCTAQDGTNGLYQLLGWKTSRMRGAQGDEVVQDDTGLISAKCDHRQRQVISLLHQTR